jgi:signal transduction histidine kinase
LNKPTLSAFITFIILTTLFIGIISYSHWLNIKHNKQLINTNNVHHVTRAAESINSLKESWQKDLAQLEKNIIQFSHITSSHNHFLQELEQHFYNTALVRPLFHQIRLLNGEGHEIVRVDQKNENVHIINHSGLQDKHNRYYFQEMKLKGLTDIYFSKFDLNVEHGTIEQPHRPIIRVGKAIKLNNKIVYIIINIEGKELLKGVAHSFNYPFQDVYFVNPNGYYLINPDPSKNWGFMYQQQHTLIKDNAALWQTIQNSEVGDSYSAKNNLAFKKVSFGVDNDAYFIISNINEQGLTDQLNTANITYYRAIVLTLLINLFVSALVYQFYKAYLAVRKEKEVEKQQHQAMLMQNNRQAAMGEMISAIAHQWRQPLNIVNGVMVNLREELSAESFNKENITKQINIAITNSRYMSQTIDDFKHFFDTKDQQTEFDLIEAIDKTQQIVNASTVDINIEFIKNSITDQLILNGKQNELQQVIINLISNARDAYQQTQLNETPKIEVNLVDDETYAYIHVIDFGVGISDEIKQKIFEPNFTTKDKLNNSGLGLYLSKMIIEQNFQGQLILNTNTLGKTIFTIKLPKIQTS